MATRRRHRLRDADAGDEGDVDFLRRPGESAGSFRVVSVHTRTILDHQLKTIRRVVNSARRFNLPMRAATSPTL
jgi:hypothetical protein